MDGLAAVPATEKGRGVAITARRRLPASIVVVESEPDF
jgi:hypothetical protein